MTDLPDLTSTPTNSRLLTGIAVTTAITYRVGLWSCAIQVHGRAFLTPTDSGRSITVELTHFPDMRPMPEEHCEAIRIKAIQGLTTQFNQMIDRKVDLGDIFLLAGVTQPTGDWRLQPNPVLGWVTGLEGQYQGLLLATNGLIGITRTFNYDYKLHSMSRWNKRRSQKVSSRNNSPAKEPAPKQNPEDLAALLMEGL